MTYQKIANSHGHIVVSATAHYWPVDGEEIEVTERADIIGWDSLGEPVALDRYKGRPVSAWHVQSVAWERLRNLVKHRHQVDLGGLWDEDPDDMPGEVEIGPCVYRILS